MNNKKLTSVAWVLAVTTTFIAIMAWGQSLKWQLSSLSIYQIFPVLGLFAFGLMWGHYIVAALRQYYQIDRSVVIKYFNITSLVVLAAILLHPGLLIWQLFKDGFGLPPNSYYQVYGWLTLLGTFSWCVFLVYELHRKFSQKQWWRYIEHLNDIAIISVYYHGLKLGTHTQMEWFRYVWYFYGITLGIALMYVYINKLKPVNKPAG